MTRNTHTVIYKVGWEYVRKIVPADIESIPLSYHINIAKKMLAENIATVPPHGCKREKVLDVLNKIDLSKVGMLDPLVEALEAIIILSNDDDVIIRADTALEEYYDQCKS